ncbi:MAG TPA: hypothetical protein VE421_00085 [Burkholderiaceae bacterium]|jgi:uncharacterized lipoprotein YbaY|nr:hypothetical protein [Burkholderiaceae bacterium]
MKQLRLRHIAAASAFALLAAGCGSSSDDSSRPTPPVQPPPNQMATEDAAASASVAGFIAFIQTMIASLSSEANEPRSIDGITPPTTDTAEPTAI